MCIIINEMGKVKSTAWKAAALPLSYTRLPVIRPDLAMEIRDLTRRNLRWRGLSTRQFGENPEKSGKTVCESPDRFPTGVPSPFYSRQRK